MMKLTSGPEGLNHEDLNVIETREVILGDELRLRVGVEIMKRFFEDAWMQTASEEWLKSIGFEVKWINIEDDMLLCMLWRYTAEPADGIDYHELLDEFILSYTGYDAQLITLYNPGLWTEA